MLRHQTPESPMYPDLLWSKPENKHQAGKLLIIGGNSFGFSAVGEAYEAALAAGSGEVRVLLPNAIQKIVGGVFENALFAPTNPSGSFSKDALNIWLEAADWSDSVLLIGDLSRNAETAALIEQFSQDYAGLLTITKDGLELALKESSRIAKRTETTLVMSMADLQLLARKEKFQDAITFELANEPFAERLVKLFADLEASCVIKRNEFVYVVHDSKISATKLSGDAEQKWRVRCAVNAAIWEMQHPGKTFEALTTSLVA